MGTTLLTCGNDLLTCGNDFLSCGNDLLSCGNDLVSCGNDLLTCGNDFLSCGNDLLTCGKCGNEIKNARKTVLCPFLGSVVNTLFRMKILRVMLTTRMDGWLNINIELESVSRVIIFSTGLLPVTMCRSVSHNGLT